MLRGEAFLVAGTSRVQLNCSILNQGEHGRLLSGFRVVGLAYKDDRDIEIIRHLLAQVLQVCSAVTTEVLARF